MQHVVRTLVTTMAVLVCAASVFAADKEKGEPPKKPLPGPFRIHKEVKLTAEQQSKLDAIAAEYLPKHKELHGQKDAVLTQEQKAARDAARKAAKTAGLKGKEEHEAVEAAVKLTAEQTAKRAAIEKKCKQLDDQIRQRVLALLTPEQKKALGKKGDKKPKGPPHHDKKPKGPPHHDKKPKGPPHHDKEHKGPPEKH